MLYIAGEGHNGFAVRLDAWERKHGVRIPADKFFVSDRAISIFDLDAAEGAAREAEALCPEGVKPALIVIDTVARAFNGGDENSTKDMTTFVDNVTAIFSQRWSSHVMVVHHTGHDSDRARGSVALKGGIDQELYLKLLGGDVRQLVATKMKDGPKPPPMSFTYEKIVLGQEIDNLGDVAEVSSLVPRALSAMDTPVQTTRPAIGKQALSPSAIIKLCSDEWPGVETITAHFQCGKKAALEVIRQTVSMGLMTKQGRGYTLTSAGRRQVDLVPGSLN